MSSVYTLHRLRIPYTLALCAGCVNPARVDRYTNTVKVTDPNPAAARMLPTAVLLSYYDIDNPSGKPLHCNQGKNKRIRAGIYAAPSPISLR